MAFSPITTATSLIGKMYGAAAQQRRADTPVKPPEAPVPMLPQPTPAPVDPLQDRFNAEMLGKLMTPGRGKRRGQSVVRGGKYSGRTPDELYGVLAKEQNRGSGLSTGSLSQGSGIDWLKANRTSGSDLAQQERNVARRGDRYDTRAGFQPPVLPVKPMPMQPMSPVGAGVGSTVPAMEKPYAQWARDYGKTPQTAPNPQAAALNASPIMARATPLVPNQFTSQMSPVSARPAPVAPTMGVAGPVGPMGAAPKPDPLSAALGQSEAAKRAYLTRAKIPEATEKDRVIDVLNKVTQRDEKLRAQNPGVKPNLIPGYGAPLEKPKRKQPMQDAIWNTMKMTARPFM